MRGKWEGDNKWKERDKAIERSEAFWGTFGTVTSESQVDKSDNSTKNDVYISTAPRKSRGKRRQRRRRRRRRQRPAFHKRSKRRRGRVYSRFGRMEIWDCSILGYASRLRRCSVIAELDFFPLFFLLYPSLSLSLLLYVYYFIFLSLFRIPSRVPFSLWRARICLYVHTYRYMSLSFSLYFLSLPFLDLYHSSLYMRRPTRVYLTPRTTNKESSRARKPLLVLGPPLLLCSLHLTTTCETSFKSPSLFRRFIFSFD